MLYGKSLVNCQYHLCPQYSLTFRDNPDQNCVRWSCFIGVLVLLEASLCVAQMVKNLLSIQEIPAGPLGWEDPLEKVIATHSSLLAWRIPWTEEPGGLQSLGLQESDTTGWLTLVLLCLVTRSSSFLVSSSGIYFNSFNPHLHANTPPISIFLMFKHYAHVSQFKPK